MKGQKKPQTAMNIARFRSYFQIFRYLALYSGFRYFFWPCILENALRKPNACGLIRIFVVQCLDSINPLKRGYVVILTIIFLSN